MRQSEKAERATQIAPTLTAEQLQLGSLSLNLLLVLPYFTLPSLTSLLYHFPFPFIITEIRPGVNLGLLSTVCALTRLSALNLRHPQHTSLRACAATLDTLIQSI